jgi:hypothetical protein
MGKAVRWILGRDLKKRNYYPKQNLEKLIMENNLIGIVKFFRDETYLNRLVDDGCIYCKTPESYRLESLEVLVISLRAVSFHIEHNEMIR